MSIWGGGEEPIRAVPEDWNPDPLELKPRAQDPTGSGPTVMPDSNPLEPQPVLAEREPTYVEPVPAPVERDAFEAIEPSGAAIAETPVFTQAQFAFFHDDPVRSEPEPPTRPLYSEHTPKMPPVVAAEASSSDLLKADEPRADEFTTRIPVAPPELEATSRVELTSLRIPIISAHMDEQPTVVMAPVVADTNTGATSNGLATLPSGDGPASRAEARRATQESGKLAPIAVPSKPTSDPDDDDRKKKILSAPWLRIAAIATAVLVLVVGGGVGIKAMVDRDSPTALPSRSVPSVSPSVQATLPPAPMEESVGDEANPGIHVPVPPPVEEEVVEAVEPPVEDATSAEGGTTVQRPPRPSVNPPPTDTRPSVIDRGSMTMDQTVVRGQTYWRLTIRNVSSTTSISVASSVSQKLHLAQARSSTYEYITPVIVGSGDVTWTIDTMDRRTHVRQTETFTTY